LNAKKDELTKIWADLDQGIPKMMEAIKSRVGILSQSKKLPANLTKEKFEEAKSGLESALKDWETAKESSKTGNLAEAVTKGNTVRRSRSGSPDPWHARSSSRVTKGLEKVRNPDYTDYEAITLMSA
jgi:hypothetical protein